jgi:TP901 family phage tail tape measure protein
MDFRLLNAFVQMRVNTQPLSYALDRMGMRLARFEQRWGSIKLGMNVRAAGQLGSAFDGMARSTAKIAANMGRATAENMKAYRVQSRIQNEANLHAKRMAATKTKEAYQQALINRLEKTKVASQSLTRGINAGQKQLAAAKAARYQKIKKASDTGKKAIADLQQAKQDRDDAKRRANSDFNKSHRSILRRRAIADLTHRIGVSRTAIGSDERQRVNAQHAHSISSLGDQSGTILRRRSDAHKQADGRVAKARGRVQDLVSAFGAITRQANNVYQGVVGKVGGHIDMLRQRRDSTQERGDRNVNKTGLADALAQGRVKKAQKAADVAKIGRGFSYAAEFAGRFAQQLGNVTAWTIKVIQPLNLLGSLLDGLFNSFTSLIGTAWNLGVALTKGIGAAAIGVVATLGFSVKAAGDQEAAMVNIGRVSGLIGKDLDVLKDKILALAETSAGASLKELNDIAEFGARLGIGDGMAGIDKGGAIAKFTKDVSKLRLALDDIPAEEAATKIVRILKVFGEGPEKINNFASALVYLDNSSTATGRDILELTRRLSGITATMGMLPEDVMALASSMRDVGIEVHVGGTAVQQLFLAMGARTKDFSKVLKINQADLKHAMDTSPVDALRMVLGRLAKYKPTAKMQFLTQLHMQGRQSASTIFQLSSAFKTLDKATDGARRGWISQESVEAAVEARSQTLWAKMHMLWNQVLVLGEAIGKHFLPVAKEMVALFGDLVAGAKDFVGANTAMFQTVANKMIAFIRILRGMFKNLPETIQILWSLFSNLLERIKDGFIGIVPKIMTTIGTIVKKIAEVLMAGWDILVPSFVAIGEMIGEAIYEGIKNSALFTIVDKIITMMGGESMKDEIQKTSERLTKTGQAIQDAENGTFPGPNGVKNKENAVKAANDEFDAAQRAHQGAIENKKMRDLQRRDRIKKGLGGVGEMLIKPNEAEQKAINDRADLRNRRHDAAVKRLNEMGEEVGADDARSAGIPKVAEKSFNPLARFKDIKGKKELVTPGGVSLGMFRTDQKNTEKMRKMLLDQMPASEHDAFKAKNSEIFEPQMPYTPNMSGYSRVKQKQQELQTANAERREATRQRGLQNKQSGVAQLTEEQKAAPERMMAALSVGGVGIAGALFGTQTRLKKRMPPGGTGLDAPMIDKDYKPEFHGLEEFSKKIQNDLFDPKKQNEDRALTAATETSSNTKNINKNIEQISQEVLKMSLNMDEKKKAAVMVA